MTQGKPNRINISLKHEKKDMKPVKVLRGCQRGLGRQGGQNWGQKKTTKTFVFFNQERRKSHHGARLDILHWILSFSFPVLRKSKTFPVCMLQRNVIFGRKWEAYLAVCICSKYIKICVNLCWTLKCDLLSLNLPLLHKKRRQEQGPMGMDSQRTI